MFVDRILQQDEILWKKINVNKPVVFWGTGNNSKIVRRLMEERGILPNYYCDNNKKNQGMLINGVPVISYDFLREKVKEGYSIVLCVAINNALEIKAQLEKQGETNPVYHLEKPFKVDDEFLEYDYVLENDSEFEQVYDMLSDDLSKELFVKNINFRLSGDKIALVRYCDGDTFFDDTIIPARDDYVYVDVGAYTGDTVIRFYGFSRGKYKKIYAIEPDKGNFSSIEHLIHYGRIYNTVTVNKGAWNKQDILTFYTTADDNIKNFDSPNFFKNMKNTMPQEWKMSSEEFVEEYIPVDTVDNILLGAECNLLKINALAADFQALQGAGETIKKYKPVIVGEFGTRKENLTKMMLYIKELNSDYRLILREKLIFGDYKTVYYAIDTSMLTE